MNRETLNIAFLSSRREKGKVKFRSKAPPSPTETKPHKIQTQMSFR